MEKCLHCSEPLKHVPGRKQKSFCNANCRNKYFYAQRKRQIEEAKALLVSLPPDYIEIKKVGILTKEGKVKPLLPNAKKEVKSISIIDLGEPAPVVRSQLYKEGDPGEGTMAFMMKYDCSSYKELEEKLKNK